MGMKGSTTMTHRALVSISALLFAASVSACGSISHVTTPTTARARVVLAQRTGEERLRAPEGQETRAERPAQVVPQVMAGPVTPRSHPAKKAA